MLSQYMNLKKKKMKINFCTFPCHGAEFKWVKYSAFQTFKLTLIGPWLDDKVNSRYQLASVKRDQWSSAMAGVRASLWSPLHAPFAAQGQNMKLGHWVEHTGRCPSLEARFSQIKAHWLAQGSNFSYLNRFINKIQITLRLRSPERRRERWPSALTPICWSIDFKRSRHALLAQLTHNAWQLYLISILSKNKTLVAEAKL